MTAALARIDAPDAPSTQLADLLADVKRLRRFDIGFPGATDLRFAELSDWLSGQLLNNVGDPFDGGHGRCHTKDLERQVVDLIGGWLRAPASRWGYVTSGASEATLHALDEAWQQFPDVVVYTSAAAHYSVGKAARLLKLPLVNIRTHPDGQINTADLAGEIAKRRHRPAAMVATAGTTMTEAIDDVAAITAVLDDLAITRRRIHVDAALSGIPLALLPDGDRPAFDFTAGATSMAVSGHKFLSTLMPCAVLVYADCPYAKPGRVAYTGSLDSTIGGSRSGHTPLILWTVLSRLGADGHRARAEAARALADYTCKRLNTIGVPATRNPHAFTVVLPTPPQQVLDKWVLSVEGQRAHIITMPGIERDQIDEFVADLQAALESPGRNGWPRRHAGGQVTAP